MLDFTDHVVLITGAGAGIGAGVAKAFHDAGARVALGDFRDKALARTAATLGGSSRVYTRAVDVRDARSTAEFFDDAERALGPVTVAVANAGIYPNTPVLEMSTEEWDRVMETNVRGVFLTCQAAARSMVARGTRGKIITLSSGAAQSGRQGAAHYCASKAGVVMFTKVLALEMAAHHINVNCISPGLIEVEGEVSPLTSEYVATLTKSIPWGRIGKPEDIAHAALFLASPLADFITGEVLAVNGGSSAGRAFLPLSTPKPS
jgi:NAD(P)-dependent dehydrogenase (short-subunit alcohol dehydrogenase family)